MDGKGIMRKQPDASLPVSTVGARHLDRQSRLPTSHWADVPQKRAAERQAGGPFDDPGLRQLEP